jgi:CBS domain-containing protein
VNAFVKDVMTAQVVWVERDTPFAAMAASLRQHRVSAFPVLNQALVGKPRTCAQGHDIVRRARHVEGVVAVRDRFDYPSPGPDPFDVLATFAID